MYPETLDELGFTSAEPSGGHKILSIWRQKLRKWTNNYIDWDLTELDQSKAIVTKTGDLTFFISAQDMILLTRIYILIVFKNQNEETEQATKGRLPWKKE